MWVYYLNKYTKALSNIKCGENLIKPKIDTDFKEMYAISSN